MAKTLTPVSTFHTDVAVPVATEALAAAGVEAPLQKLLDRTEWLKDNGTPGPAGPPGEVTFGTYAPQPMWAACWDHLYGVALPIIDTAPIEASLADAMTLVRSFNPAVNMALAGQWRVPTGATGVTIAWVYRPTVAPAGDTVARMVVYRREQYPTTDVSFPAVGYPDRVMDLACASGSIAWQHQSFSFTLPFPVGTYFQALFGRYATHASDTLADTLEVHSVHIGWT
jgi:hypothetical protein